MLIGFEILYQILEFGYMEQLELKLQMVIFFPEPANNGFQAIGGWISKIKDKIENK